MWTIPLEDRRAQAWTDGGGQRGDECACACVIEFEGRVYERARRLGNTVTHNVAEYQGVILAIEYAIDLGVRRLDIRSDSQLIVGQLEGTKKTREPHLKPLLEPFALSLRISTPTRSSGFPVSRTSEPTSSAGRLCCDERPPGARRQLGENSSRPLWKRGGGGCTRTRAG